MMPQPRAHGMDLFAAFGLIIMNSPSSHADASFLTLVEIMMLDGDL